MKGRANMGKRSRRKASEIDKLRSKMLKIVQRESEITLTSLVRQYGASIGIRDTPSDKNLAKRQLDVLAKNGSIEFNRFGRDLVAKAAAPAGVQAAPHYAAPAAAQAVAPVVQAPAAGGLAAHAATPELQAIRAYANQMGELSNALQQQLQILVRMVDQSAQ